MSVEEVFLLDLVAGLNPWQNGNSTQLPHMPFSINDYNDSMSLPHAPSGFLNINKPSGMTSREAVNVVQRLLPRKTKIGHAGTLDPLAEGVLVVGFGAGTRLIEYVQRMPKHYSGTFLLGRSSPTEDTDGPVTELANPPVPSREELTKAAARLTGTIQQRPPAYSALKVDGQRAYKLARQGREVTLVEREVTVYRLALGAYRYPKLVLEIECGSGTYVRSLGRDLAESVGTAAVMSGLTRSAIGRFSLDEAVLPEKLDRANLADHLLPLRRAVELLPALVLGDQELEEIQHGRKIARPPGLPEAPEIAGIDPTGRLASILVPRGEAQLGPSRSFLSGD
ncbi:MAG: tRNA pseudouridine(55) synthase TruB [Pirellulales bacterium]|nr:tRNA pseudouridine(55) synthase TruB [Pirellulales bacterium]